MKKIHLIGTRTRDLPARAVMYSSEILFNAVPATYIIKNVQRMGTCVTRGLKTNIRDYSNWRYHLLGCCQYQTMQRNIPLPWESQISHYRNSELLGFWLFPSSGILKATEYNVSETGFVSVLRWGGRHPPVSETFFHYYLGKIRTMDKVWKPSISVCYTPSSEPYSI
jgi:hypothetical protein